MGRGASFDLGAAYERESQCSSIFAASIVFKLRPTGIQKPAARKRSTAPLTRFALVEFDYRGRLGFGRWVCMSFVDDTETEHCWPNEPPVLGWCNDYFPDLLARRVPNWSQGEGGCGVFTWVLAENPIAHSHFTGFCFPEPVHFEE